MFERFGKIIYRERTENIYSKNVYNIYIDNMNYCIHKFYEIFSVQIILKQNYHFITIITEKYIAIH